MNRSVSLGERVSLPSLGGVRGTVLAIHVQPGGDVWVWVLLDDRPQPYTTTLRELRTVGA